MSENLKILILDDDIKIAELLKIHLLDIIKAECFVFEDHQEALKAINAEKYDIVISDYQMPEISGVDFLHQVNVSSPATVRILFSGFGQLNTLMEEQAENDIGYFISKPWQIAQLKIIMSSIQTTIDLLNENTSLKEQLEKKPAAPIKNDSRLTEEIVKSFTTAISQSSKVLLNHSRRMAALCKMVARDIGLSDDQISKVEIAALLHDYGLINLPKKLHTTSMSYMSKVEVSQYQQHPASASAVFDNITPLKEISQYVKLHHENIDGSGFYGFKGSNIPIEAKVLRVCEYYDEGQNFNNQAHQNILQFMDLHRGKWFDPDCLSALKNIMKK